MTFFVCLETSLHMKSDHNFNENQFKILSTGNSDFDCKIREALLIKSEKPTLNQQLFQNGSTFILCVFK